MKRYWIKLWLEIIDDPKMGRLPDWLWRRAIELFLLAGENGDDGLLQPVSDLAWRLRPATEDQVTESLQALSKVGVVHETPDGWAVTNFGKRQEAISSTERVRQYRKRERNENETKRSNNETANVSDSVSVSPSDSPGEGGAGGEPDLPGPDEIFTAHFRALNGKRERQRWETLVESIGPERAEEIAAWAERKEIHMVNRGSLLDSLETAAKKWMDPKPAGKKHSAVERQAETMANIAKGLDMAFPEVNHG